MMLELIYYPTISLVYIVNSVYSLCFFLLSFSFMNKFFLWKKKCIHELGPRYRHGMFSQKSRAYDYRDPSILTLPKYNTITHGIKCFMYEGAKLWNSISNGNKTIENISEFKTLLKKWNGSPFICKNCIICTISYM